MSTPATTRSLTLNPLDPRAPTRGVDTPPSSLPPSKTTKGPLTRHPNADRTKTDNATSKARIYFIGTATTVLEWAGIRLLTDPNFLHAGDHVHLGPGITSTRRTNPAVDLHELPRIDVVLLSHYHADHFDQVVENSLRRCLPIITTPHAKQHLTSKGNESFTNVHGIPFFDSVMLNIPSRSEATTVPPESKPITSRALVGGEGAEIHISPSRYQPAIRITAMPGKHVPPGPINIISKLNNLLGVIPPTNGWVLELGRTDANSHLFETGYRIYVTGDTLMVDDLKSIPEKYNADKGNPIDLMLIHLGGTTIPGLHMPLLMVTMDAKMGVECMRLVKPEWTVPIHYDDYDVFLSGLEDFKKEVEKGELDMKVVYLDRGDAVELEVKGTAH